MGKVIRVKKGDQEFDVQESKLQLALDDGFTPVKEGEKLYTVSKGDKEYQVKESNLPSAEAEGFKKKSNGISSQEYSDIESSFPSKYSSIDYSKNFFTKNQFDEPEIETEEGVKLTINPRTIPVTPYANQEDYVLDVQKRIKSGTKTAQDEKFLSNAKKYNKNFTPDDDTDLSVISNKHNLPSEFTDVDSKLIAVNQLKDILQKKQLEEDNQFVSSGGAGMASTYVPNAGKLKDENLQEFERLNELKGKLINEKQKTDTYKVHFNANIRTDESGNLLKKAMAGMALITPLASAQGEIAISQQTVDHLEKMPVEFSVGLNGLKYTEPTEYKRVVKMLEKGEPISESQIANITAHGLDTKEAILKDGLIDGNLTQQQYQEETQKLQKVRYDNIVGNKETLRAFLSGGIADIADDIESEKSGLPHEEITKSIFGHTWNYSDAEIEQYGKSYAQASGIDPNDARVKEAIKYLQDNEGAMIMENSIAKTGAVRDLAKGLATPIRGIYNTVEGVGKTDADRYAEGQSQGNINVSEQRLSRIKNNPVSDAVSDVLEGTGQFLTQAGLAAATSGLIGTAAKGLAATSLGATTAGETIGAGANIGKMLLSSKNAMSTFVTAYAQAYDSNLKQALTYTEDDSKARVTAGIMSGLEGATELFLSPLDIAQGIGNKLFNKKKISKSLIGVLNDAAIVDKNAAIKNLLKSYIKGVGESGKVIAAEIGEETVINISDYAANSILNPQSKTFQNRELSKEIANTAYQTGLSMAFPALASGVGAYKVNNFSKGSLLVAAQNRLQLIDDMKQRLFNGDMSQDEFNEKSAIINTAAKSNDIIPVKDNGKKLTPQEKANYIYSRVSESILNKKLKILEEDKSRGVGKIGEGEDATNVEDPEITQIKKKIEAQVKYRTDILSLKPQYYVDSEPVSKQEFNDILKSEDVNKYDLSVENDNKTQEKLREIGGKDDLVKDITKVEQKEEKIKPVDTEVKVEPVAELLDIEEEEPVQQQAYISPLQSNLQAAREHVKGTPEAAVIESDKTTPVINPEVKDPYGVSSTEVKNVKSEEVKEPSQEQQLKDVMAGNTVTFKYESMAEVPDVFKDKISSQGETNGKKEIRVTVAKSLADYELEKSENKPIQSKESTETIKNEEAKATEIPNTSEEKSQPKEVVSEPIGETEKKDFDSKVDERADNIINKLTPKGMKGVKSNGLTVESLVRVAAYTIKKSYHAGVEINKAIEDAVFFIKDRWQGAFGDFDENVVRAELIKIQETLPSEKNRKVIDGVVNKIIDGSLLKSKAISEIKNLPVSDITKEKLINYLNDSLKEKKKGTYEALDDNEKSFYDNYENKFLNGEMSYESIMHLLGSVSDKQLTPELQDKYNNIRNIFYAQNNKRAKRKEKEVEVKEVKNFNDDINNTRLGLSDEELRLYDQAERITKRGTVNLVNDTTLLNENDQLRQTFQLNEFGNDLNQLLMKFQMQYGADKYLEEMEGFVADERNQLDARIAVSTILNNHLEDLSKKANSPNEAVRIKSLILKNAAASQPIATRVALALNALRAWNGLTNSEQAWLGIINPSLKSGYDAAIDALGSEITDEDLEAVDNDTLNVFEDTEKTIEEQLARKKTAGYFRKKSVKNYAKVIKVKTKEELRDEIEKQKKNCK